MSLRATECLFQELKRERFTRELLVANRETMEKADKLIDAALSLIELGIQCFILCLEEPLDITQHFSSSISRLI